MSVRRFVGANSRDVMRQVREALGEDALIVANRRTEGGVEILAGRSHRPLRTFAGARCPRSTGNATGTRSHAGDE